MNYFLLVKIFLSAVKTVEQLMPQSAGKDKFDAAMAIAEGIIGNVESYAPVLKGLATLAVTTYRATGTFASK